MTVLLINGSPHSKGETSYALSLVEKALNEKGINTKWFWIGNKMVRGCIDCGLCKNVCPEIEKNQYNSVIGSYAAITKDKDAIDRSTSGGVFSEIAKYIIMHSGVVYGCSWNDNKSVHHRMVEKIQDLKY